MPKLLSCLFVTLVCGVYLCGDAAIVPPEFPNYQVTNKEIHLKHGKLHPHDGHKTTEDDEHLLYRYRWLGDDIVKTEDDFEGEVDEEYSDKEKKVKLPGGCELTEDQFLELEAFKETYYVKKWGDMPNKPQNHFLIPPTDSQTTTFGKDAELPSLPLPDITHTLNRYLDSLKPFISEEEYLKYVERIESFLEGVGKKLNEKLKTKAENKKNWLEQWWENVAYLQGRLPLLPYCSMDGVLPREIASWTYGNGEDQIKHASLFCYYLVQYWTLLRKEAILPTKTADRTQFSMSQYRRLFNTTRIPGQTTDKLISYFKTVSEGFCPATVVIICKGRLFCMNVVDSKENPINPLQWEEALRKILRLCSDYEDGPGLPILTCDARSNWSKNREYLEALSNKNKEMLHLIDRSLFLVVLDDASPETESDVTNCNVCGDYTNRWTDKSMCMIFYKNGRSGAVCEHSAFDGIVVIDCHHYVLSALENENDEWKRGGNADSVPVVEEMKFEMDDTIKKEIERLKVETLENKKEIKMTRRMFEDYGKLEIRNLKFNPDSYIQMCLQLAYFDLHRKPAACYETATTRKFYNGRTETVRCCTTQCLKWVTAMLDPKYTNVERRTLFELAVKRHDELMAEAKENAGCDRHLFGIYCTALEEGIEIPEIFFDPAYLKSGGGGNFTLSTSCTGYTSLGGGVAPMCVDGYGVFYNIMPNKVCFSISINTKTSETDDEKYFNSLKKALRETRHMLLAGVTKSKI